MQPELVSSLRKGNIYNVPQGNGSESRTEAPSAGTPGSGSAHSSRPQMALLVTGSALLRHFLWADAFISLEKPQTPLQSYEVALLRPAPSSSCCGSRFLRVVTDGRRILGLPLVNIARARQWQTLEGR